MIGKLIGRLDESGEDWAILLVGGVGYLVQASRRTLSVLEAAEGEVALWVETQFREDRIQLVGFAERAERDWYRLLAKVQGVGPRLALSILSVLPPEPLGLAIAAEDAKALTAAPGVGQKLARRICGELKDRVPMLGSTAAALAADVAATASGAPAEAVSALVNLGYKRSEALGAVGRAERALGEGAGLAALIRQGLKELSS